jgi:hypothetical protein
MQWTMGRDAPVYLYFICIWAWERSIGGREVDPINNKIKDRDIFLRKRYFFSTFFLARVFT